MSTIRRHCHRFAPAIATLASLAAPAHLALAQPPGVSPAGPPDPPGTAGSSGPTGPGPTLTPLPPPPPPPPSTFVYAISLGVGYLGFDPGRSGCAPCRAFPPALDTHGALGLRLLPSLAIGGQLAVQVEFLSHHPGNDARLGAFAAFAYGQLTVLPRLQLIAGLGYGGARYQYTVVDDQILFTTSRDVTDSLGSGAAQLAAVRFLLPPLVQSFRHPDFALEARYTRIALGPHGVIQGFSADFVGGRF